MSARRTAALLAATLAATPAAAQLVPALGEAGTTPGAPPPANVTLADGAPGAQPGQGGTPAPLFDPGRMPPPLPLLSPSTPLRRREQRNVAMATAWRNRACTPTREADGTLVFQQGACEITVVCSPLRICDVALEPGEKPTAVPAVGDPRVGLQREPRWSGSGASQTLHMIFQPSDAGLSSGVNLQTDRRTISFLVVTRAGQYMPLVRIRDQGAPSETGGWAAAAAMGRAGLAAGGGSGDPCDQPPTISPSAFRIEGSRWGGAPEWQPTQVYGVAIPSGTATCVEFPADIAGMDAPTLIPRDGGTPGIENVRASRRRYRVDRLLSQFDLVAGTGGSGDRVTVRRKK